MKYLKLCFYITKPYKILGNFRRIEKYFQNITKILNIFEKNLPQ